MKQDHIFYRIVNGMIRLLLAGAVFLLFLHSIYSTSFVGKLILEDGSEQERTLNIADSVAIASIPAPKRIAIPVKNNANFSGFLFN